MKPSLTIGSCARIVVILLVHTAAINAQTYPLTWYRSFDGLAHSMVASIVQDDEGYLWCGTWNGVSRFDGSSFRNFNSDASKLSHKFIPWLILDSTGLGVWCVIDEEGVAHIDRYGNVTHLERVVRGKSEALHDTRFIVAGEHGSLWITTTYGALLHRRRDGTWKEYSPENGKDFGSGGWPVWYAPRHELWVLSSESQITCINEDGKISIIENSKCLPASSHSAPLRFFAMTVNRKTGGVWIRTNNGFVSIDGSQPTIRFFKEDGLLGFAYLRANTDQEGNIWCAQQRTGQPGYAFNKFSHRDGSMLRSIGNVEEFENMIPFGVVFEDSEGSVWIAGGALAHLSSYAVMKYRMSQNGYPVGGRNLVSTKNGDLYFGSWSGVYRFNQDIYSPPHPIFLLPANPLISEIFVTPDNVLRWNVFWGRSYFLENGRSRKDIAWPRWSYRGRVYPIPGALSIMSDGSMAFHAGNGTSTMYLISAEGDSTTKTLGIASGLDPISWGQLAVRHASIPTLYQCTSKAIWQITPRTHKRFDARAGYRPGKVATLCEDSTGAVWIGFRGPNDSTALLRFDGTKFAPFSKQQLGLPSNAVTALCAHPNRRDLIVATINSISIVDLRSMKVRKVLTEQDGIPYFCSGMIIDRNGVLWITSVGEVVRFDEPMELVVRTAPRVVLSSFTADTMTIQFPSTISSIRLESSPRRIEIKYSALSFTSQQLLFQTKIDGLNEEWSAPTQDKFVRFTYLNPGSYRFQVRAVDPGGRWISRSETFEFVIPPPYYSTWWFIAAINLLLIGLIVAFYRYRLGHAIKLERMRNQIALDLHDEVSSMLTSISFLGMSAGNDLEESHPAKPKVAMVAETARSIIDIIGDIIWSLKPQNDSFNDLGKRLGDMAVEMCEGRDIRLHIDILPPEPNIPIRLDRRRNLYLIAKEAVHNALKHSQCTELRVALQSRDGYIELSISDNGVGIGERKRGVSGGTGTGMESMRVRAAQAHAYLEIETGAQEGTTVHIRVKPS
ncbi:MAG: ATP-binding protein [Bacteroidota bacterium]